jgi:hypothetical protein
LPQLVRLPLKFVNPAVHFDNQTSLRAIEVDNETVNRMLPPEAQAIDLAVT